LQRYTPGISVPAIDEKPDIADADALRRALSHARGIYLPDPERATAGIHFAKVLRTLGIMDLLRSRLRPYPNGATAMRAMADAGEPDLIGCTQVSEILLRAGWNWWGSCPVNLRCRRRMRRRCVVMRQRRSWRRRSARCLEGRRRSRCGVAEGSLFEFRSGEIQSPKSNVATELAGAVLVQHLFDCSPDGVVFGGQRTLP